MLNYSSIGLLPIDEVAQDYLKFCVDYDNSIGNTKYVLGKMYKLNNERLQKKKYGREVEDSEKLEQIWLVLYANCHHFLFFN